MFSVSQALPSPALFHHAEGSPTPSRSLGSDPTQSCGSWRLYLTNCGELSQQHLEHGRRQGLLQHLQELLRLPTHSDCVRQVVHALLVFTCGRHGAAVCLQGPLPKRGPEAFTTAPSDDDPGHRAAEI